MKRTLKISLTLMILLVILSSLAFADVNYINSDKVAFFQNIEIPTGRIIRGDIVSIFGNAKIHGEIYGDVVTIFGNVEMTGTVKGDVVSVFGSIDMKENAKITGDRVQVLGSKSIKSIDSIVIGQDTNVYINGLAPNLSTLMIILLIIVAVKTLFSFIFSLILAALVPERINKVVNSLKLDIVRRFGIGLLVSIIYVISLIILSAIIIGLPIIPVLVLVMFLLGFGGNTAIKVALGRKITKGSSSIYLDVIIGSIIYVLLELTIIIKPVLYLAKLVGIGTIVDTKIGIVDYWQEKVSKPAIDFNENNLNKDILNRDNES